MKGAFHKDYNNLVSDPRFMQLWKYCYTPFSVKYKLDCRVIHLHIKINLFKNVAMPTANGWVTDNTLPKEDTYEPMYEVINVSWGEGIISVSPIRCWHWPNVDGNGQNNNITK